MANLTANKIWETQRRGRNGFVVADGVELFAGELVEIDANGFLNKNTGGAKFVGLLHEGVIGDTSASPPPEGKVNTAGEVLKNIAVAGIVQADVGKQLTCATSNIEDAAIVASGGIGIITRFVSAGVCDIELRRTTEIQA